jgi:hypothetical protein
MIARMTDVAADVAALALALYLSLASELTWESAGHADDPLGNTDHRG